jgi:hypothetical protein
MEDNFFNNSSEREDQLRQMGRPDLADIMKANREGYAGILPNGNIVDRRIHPNAMPIPENKMMNIPKPNKV